MLNKISTERNDLFEPNIYIAIKFDIVGDEKPDKLITAINKVFTTFESTMSRVVLSSDGEACYEKMMMSGCSAKITQSDWIDLILENEKKPFSIQTGELMRVFVKPCENKTEILVMAHHLVGDGKSVVYFIETVMRTYTGETVSYKPLHLVADCSLPEKSGLPRKVRWWVNTYNRRWRKTGKNFTWGDYLQLHQTYWSNRKSVILTKSFRPEVVEKMHAKATDLGVTLNSYIVTAFLKADVNLSSIGIAVDARLDGNRTMSNQTTGITADYSYNDKRSFAENAQRVHNDIYKKLNSPVSRYFILHLMPLFTPSLIDSILMHTYGLYDNPVTKKLADIMGYTAIRSTAFGITNLTKLDITCKYNDFCIENLCFIPPVVSYSRQTIGVATIDSGMTVTCHCMNDEFAEKRKQIFNDTMEILLSVLLSTPE